MSEGQPDTPQTPEPGTPEYEQHMAAVADGKVNPDGTPVSQPEGDDKSTDDNFQPKDENGKWLGKYESPEELAKAYKELERKLGQQTNQQSEGDDKAKTADLKRPQSDEGQPEGDNGGKDGDGDDGNTPDIASIFEEFGPKFAQQGELTNDDYKTLEERGFPREAVEVYEAGLRSMHQARVDAAIQAVGSEDEFNAVREWAGRELSDAEFEAFSKQLASAQTPEQVGVVYATLATRYHQANGESTLAGDGGPNRQNSGGGFRSKQEMVQAMQDPRYQTDPAYRQDVERKIANSTFL